MTGAPVVTTTSIVLCFNKHRLTHSPGKWSLKRRETPLKAAGPLETDGSTLCSVQLLPLCILHLRSSSSSLLHTCEYFLGFFVKVRDGNPRGQHGVVGMFGRHGSGRLCSQVVQLDGGNTGMQSVDHFQRYSSLT